MQGGQPIAQQGAQKGAAMVEILSLWGPEEFARQLEDDARAGLSGTPKSLPPKYFYDARVR